MLLQNLATQVRTIYVSRKIGIYLEFGITLHDNLNSFESWCTFDKYVFGGELYTGVLFFNTKAYVDMVKALEQVLESE